MLVVERDDRTYTLRDDDTVVWRTTVAWSEPACFTFWAEVVWTAASVVAVGAGGEVAFLDLQTGRERMRFGVAGYFGYLELVDDDLFVLGCRRIARYRSSLERVWQSDDIAVDGITLGSVADGVVQVNCEMDPPGGWFAVTLDLATGTERSREPAFTDGYVGLYGSADPRA